MKFDPSQLPSSQSGYSPNPAPARSHARAGAAAYGQQGGQGGPQTTPEGETAPGMPGATAADAAPAGAKDVGGAVSLSGAAKSLHAAHGATAPNVPNATGPANAAIAGHPNVRLSSAATQLRAAAGDGSGDFDAAKVASLREQVRNGSYTPHAGKMADAMIRDAQAMAPGIAAGTSARLR